MIHIISRSRPTIGIILIEVYYIPIQLPKRLVQESIINQHQMTFLDTWGTICGIIYTAAWGISFYGQVYENWRYKSVEGFSLNYEIFNIVGYTFYSFYCTFGFFFHEQGAGTVVVSDLVFAYHSLFIVLFVQGIQCIIYKRGKNRISEYTTVICILLWIFVIVEALLAEIFKVIPKYQYFNPVSVLGYCKLTISFLKYGPAVYWNYKRKSTKGWSIFNIILDMVGGIFSFASGSIDVDDGLNITKLILSITTIFFDTIFIIQHYCLYKKNSQFYDKNSSMNTPIQENQEKFMTQNKSILLDSDSYINKNK